MKPGLSFDDYNQLVEKVMGAKIAGLGLGDDAEALRKYFPHAPSHGLGLDVHDPIVGYLAMETNMVITLEPGIYIPEEGIGVRHEDDLLITEEGVENLSGEIK